MFLHALGAFDSRCNGAYADLHVQTFTVRQLKSNAFTVIRAAEADAMALVTHRDQPTALVVALDWLGLADAAAARFADLPLSASWSCGPA